jgi:hypothetical protein
LQVGIDFPNLRCGSDAVPARQHSHIDEREGIGPSDLDGLLHTLQSLLALHGRIDLKRGAAGWRCRLAE